MDANDASVKDMEAAAVAYVAEITNTPFLALKVTTMIMQDADSVDFVDSDDVDGDYGSDYGDSDVDIDDDKFVILMSQVVTDIVDGERPTHEEFLENLSTAATSLQQKIPLLIDFIVGKKLSDL